MPDAGVRRRPLARRNRAPDHQPPGQREELDSPWPARAQGMPVFREAGDMKSANRELVDRLAAEYVLGTLRYRARRRFERWLLSPQVGALVKAWEERLAGLEPKLTPVTPPATVWRGIEDKLELRNPNRPPCAGWASPPRCSSSSRSEIYAAAGSAAPAHAEVVPAGRRADYLLARRDPRRQPGAQPARPPGARPPSGQGA